MSMKIGIVGWGYVGAATGIGFSEINNDLEVYVFDPFKNVSDWSFKYINDLFIDKRHITQVDSLEKMKNLDLIFLCLPTPESKNGEIDMSFYNKIMPDLLKIIKEGDLVIRSTILPGTTELLQKKYPSFRFAHNPEFLKEKTPLADFLSSDRVVIGSENKELTEKILTLYKNMETRKIVVDSTTSEIIKYASNCFLATKISFFNEIYEICEKFGVDSEKVSEAVAADRRIGYYGVYGGRPFGGTCLPKDISALINHSYKIGLNTRVLRAVKEVNDNLKNKKNEFRS